MPMPASNIPALDVYDNPGLEPWTVGDEDRGWSLLHFLTAVGEMFKEINTLVNADDNSQPNWSKLINVDDCPEKFLPYLAQFVGVRYLGGPREALRDAIRRRDGFGRGSLATFTAAGRAHLTDPDAPLHVFERDGSAYRIAVTGYSSTAPDAAAMLAALTAQKPAGLVLDFATHDGWSVGAVEVTYPGVSGVSNVETDFATVEDFEEHIPS